MLYEFLISDEFERYQKHQVEELVIYLEKLFLLSTPEEFLEFKGAIDMARRLIRLPQKLVKGDGKKKKIIEAMVTKNIKELHSRFAEEVLQPPPAGR